MEPKAIKQWHLRYPIDDVNIQVESGELKVESGVATAWLTDMQGRREEVRLTPAGNGKYTLDLTSRP